MKKPYVFSGLAIAVLAVVSVPFLTDSEERAVPSPEKFAQEYLELGQENKYEEVADLVIDDRFNNDREVEIETYKMLAKDMPALESYEIKEVKEVTEDSAKVVAVLNFADGSIDQIPMNLVKQDAEWRLHISDGNVRDDKDFKHIKQPD